jgi:protein-tyrosine-phosphatase
MLDNIDKIYFVCSGNIIRSAFAELFLKHLLDNKSRLIIGSFGTTYHNTKIHYKTNKYLSDIGISTNQFVPTHISEIVLDDKTIVFGMTKEHLRLVNSHWDKFPNLYLLSEINSEIIEIADPYFADNQDLAFKKAFQQIMNYTEHLSKQLL